MNLLIKDVHCCGKTPLCSRNMFRIVSLPYTQQQKTQDYQACCSKVIVSMNSITNWQYANWRDVVAGWEKMKIGCLVVVLQQRFLDTYTQSYCASCNCKQALQK
jgi:hypothetical protein